MTKETVTARIFDAYEDMALAQKIAATRHRSLRNGVPNAQFAQTDKAFIDACKRAEIPPTARQASKYRNRRGAAYAMARRSPVINSANAEPGGQ
jgi:hypothetical protein